MILRLYLAEKTLAQGTLMLILICDVTNDVCVMISNSLLRMRKP